MTQTFTIAYRTGGTENAQWRRTLAYATKAEATEALNGLVKAGYAAMVYDTKQLDSIGLPEVA